MSRFCLSFTILVFIFVIFCHRSSSEIVCFGPACVDLDKVDLSNGEYDLIHSADPKSLQLVINIFKHVFLLDGRHV